MSDLPDTPEAGSDSYFKPSKIDENKSFDLRILGPARAYLQAWKAKRPVRKNYGEDWREDEFDALGFNGQEQRPRLAWAFPIWNYEKQMVQVWEVTQATIRKQLRAMKANKRWGDLERYDLTITRTGSGTDTEYSIQPNPVEPLSADATEAWATAQACGFSLEALMTGGDPFNTDGRRKREVVSDELANPNFDELNPPPITDAELPF